VLSADAPPPEVDAERNAGLIGYNASASRPRSLPSSANFSRSGTSSDACFWLIGDSLFRASALQVLRDVRQELGAGDGPSAWTVGLLARVQERAERMNLSLPMADRALVPAMLSEGNDLGMDWLALALWVVYGPVVNASGGTVWQVHLPRRVVYPRIGGDSWPAASGLVSLSVSFNPADLSGNPFVNVGPEIDVTGSPPPPASSSGLLWVAGLGALALLAGSRR